VFLETLVLHFQRFGESTEAVFRIKSEMHTTIQLVLSSHNPPLRRGIISVSELLLRQKPTLHCKFCAVECCGDGKIAGEKAMQTGYYRLTKPWPDEPNWKVGGLWYYVGSHGDNEAHIIQHNDAYYVDEPSFEEHFEFEPDGVMLRQKEMVEINMGLHHIATQQQTMLTSQPDVLAIEFDDPDVVLDVPAPPPSKSKELVASPEEQISTAATGIKTAKTKLATIRRQIARQQKQLLALTREQELILREQTAALTEQMELMGEAIYVLSAYLGKDEEIIRIKNGKRAPADTKIVIRQLVLYMDEESAAADNWAKKGGMDFEDVREFDQWVVKPKNLAQVCPDSKGIVAIKPRRNDKFYGDNPFLNAELNRQNKCLYILVRNGDLIYRVHTNLWMEDVFFPRSDEFEDFFCDKRCDWQKHNYSRRPMRPGSGEYMRAMKAAESHRRRFYAALLLIQGILDRTKILQPLPVEGRLNIVDVHESVKYCIWMKDAEGLLGEGHKPYREWLAEVNGSIGVGNRVVGFWPYGGSNSEYGPARRHPQTAKDPKDGVIHRLEKRDGDGYRFYYSREGEEVRHGWDWFDTRPAKNRASYKIYPRDQCFLNFDAVCVKDLQHYMGSRTERHNYKTMLPLMQICLDLKKEEAKVETPFRKLLVSQCAKIHGVTLAQANERIDELIQWWKFKNKAHRALKEDDSKALRMIIKEFGVRWQLEQEKKTMTEVHSSVLEGLMEDAEDTLAVFHRGENRYVLFKWMNDENVFVCEEHWEHKGDQLFPTKNKPWTTVDNRYLSWTLIWQHDRWKDWDTHASALLHLTDPEREAAMKCGLAALKRKDKQALLNWTERKKEDRYWFAPLAVVVCDGEEGGEKLYIYYLKAHCYIPTDHPLTGPDPSEPDFARLKVSWEKKRGKELVCEVHNSSVSGVCLNPEMPPWRPDYTGALNSGRDLIACLAEFEDNIKAALAEIEKVAQAKHHIREMQRPVDRLERQIFDRTKELWWQDKKAEFDEEYEDPDGDLWEEHKEETDDPSWHSLHPGWVSDFAYPLLEKGIDLNGMTVAELRKQSGQRLEKCRGASEWFDRVKDLVLDTSYDLTKEEKEFQEEVS
jgi:hypothetical protein